MKKKLKIKVQIFGCSGKIGRSGNLGPIFQHKESAALNSSCPLLNGEWTPQLVMFFTHLSKLPA